ncbi:hypothetical protein [Coraliomargarita parva]|uniref:hypothetical protein n=1 Tax=Coraliomargarita parva TaxID=3014050 RepID=UPI0022B4CA40|nr:hypothetical protein [Coraliomargarita parva]
MILGFGRAVAVEASKSLIVNQDYLAKGGNLTDSLQAALDDGVRDIHFPSGVYELGSLSLPENSVLNFSRGAVVKPEIDSLKGGMLLKVTGDRVEVQGLQIDFSLEDGEIGTDVLKTLIYARNVSGLRIHDFRSLRSTADYKSKDQKLVAVSLENCDNVKIEDCEVRNFYALVVAEFTRNLDVLNNRATHCEYITLARQGCEWVLHEGNWSSRVRFQCQWWGGDANDGHKQVPRGTASTVHRGLRSSETGYHKDTAGSYDIQVLGNYAEYGMTLAWGSKGRSVIISDNIAYYMDDMAYDTEGTGTVVIANNISVNSKYYGIGCYFWGDSVVISGNLIMVEPFGEAKYQGEFLRLHSPNASGFGNRKILITGNQFVAREGSPRKVVIEACKDVNISGNKFVNGFINAISKSEELTITGNEFVNDLPGNYAAIRTQAGSKRLFIKDNIMRRLYNEEDPVADNAALSGIAGNGLRVVEGNIIEGWTYSAWTGQAGRYQGTLLFQNNSATGQLLRDSHVKPDRMRVSGNLNLVDLSELSFRPATEAERKAPVVAKKKVFDPNVPNAPQE